MKFEINLTLLVVFLILIFLYHNSSAQHPAYKHQIIEDTAPFQGYPKAVDWRKKYVGRGGIGCCGIKDCIPVGHRLGIIIQGKDYSIAKLDDIEFEVETKSIHASEDGQNWYCGRQLFADWEAKCHGDKWLKNPQICYQCVFLAPGI